MSSTSFSLASCPDACKPCNMGSLLETGVNPDKIREKGLPTRVLIKRRDIHKRT